MNFFRQWLHEGRHLHLQQGPIDLIIAIEGDEGACRAGYDAACQTFDGLLESLVAVLPALRTELPSPASKAQASSVLWGSVGARMLSACTPYAQQRVTPMAAVAGSVADEILDAVLQSTDIARLQRVWVNNGGDIALFLREGEQFVVSLVQNPQQHLSLSPTDRYFSAALQTNATIKQADGVAGVATSGRHGRSLSLGIADAVTVLAKNAAVADVAATLIANAVDLPQHPLIERCAAATLDLDSDLGERLVVSHVPELDTHDCAQALQAGLDKATEFLRAGLVKSVYLTLQDQMVTTDTLSLLESIAIAAVTSPSSDSKGVRELAVARH